MLLKLFIFLVVVLVYLHIQYHQKTSNKLEVNFLENPTKDELNEICDLRQPVIFNNYLYIDIDKYNTLNILDSSKNIYVMTKCDDISNNEDISNTYLSKYNDHININIRNNDNMLEPYMCLKQNTDYIMGSSGYISKVEYNINYKNYYYVYDGEIELTLIPPKYKKYFNINENIEQLEYSSNHNVWDNMEKFDKILVKVNKGEIIYIPAYWMYSIKFKNESKICKLTYDTYMSLLSILPQLIKQYLHINS